MMYLNEIEILADVNMYFGIPVTRCPQRLRRLLDPVISDPFIPNEIRTAVLICWIIAFGAWEPVF